jgi:hypothetical protein
VAAMEHDYRNTISHIDIDRTLDGIGHFSFEGLEGERISEFRNDIEAGNDSIELHLIKSKSYREGIILRLKKSSDSGTAMWKELLKEDQKTFGGSKIFYINDSCSRLLVLSVENERKAKINMVVTRLNKINDKISRLNSKIKKDNLETYVSKIKSKEASDRNKDEIINFINQNLKV